MQCYFRSSLKMINNCYRTNKETKLLYTYSGNLIVLSTLPEHNLQADVISGFRNFSSELMLIYFYLYRSEIIAVSLLIFPHIALIPVQVATMRQRNCNSFSMFYLWQITTRAANNFHVDLNWWRNLLRSRWCG